MKSFLLVNSGEGRVTYFKPLINPCFAEPSPCYNGGECIRYGQTDYKCICPPQTFGQSCELGKLMFNHNGSVSHTAL